MCAVLFLVPVGLLITLVGWGIYELNNRESESLIIAGPVMFIGIGLAVLSIWIVKSEWDAAGRRRGER